MDKITGIIERITYYNQENGYTVLRFRPEQRQDYYYLGLNLDGLLTVTGYFFELSTGERIEFTGEYTTHPKHGLQFSAQKFERFVPVSQSGIERYLGSGLIKGIGPQLAKRIVNQFKDRTLDVIENNPKRLEEVPGIGKERIEKIILAWKEQKAVKEVLLFMHDHKINSNTVLKIYKTYGDHSIEVVKNNPYQLEQDVFGIGFKTADQIAQNLGLPHDHPGRIDAGIIYTLNEEVSEGHVYTLKTKLIKQAQGLLHTNEENIFSSIRRLIIEDRIRVEGDTNSENLLKDPLSMSSYKNCKDEEVRVYLTPFLVSEKGVAVSLKKLIDGESSHKQQVLWTDKKNLSAEQISAIRSALTSNVSILTGGPGTGKTTCLRALIDVLEIRQLSYALASPTGRAAKRLANATGRGASTIHRLLGFSSDGSFQFNENRPLDIDFLIVDEASMLDLLLFFHLLKALKADTQLLLVGDVDQLPPVGAGDVLRDLITSKTIPVSRLTTIFRQAEASKIITNAHRVNQGIMPNFSNSLGGDFFIFPANDADAAANWIVDLVAERIPKKFKINPITDIQILSPIYRGTAGVDALNSALQNRLNPKTAVKQEQKLFGTLFRLGDKVMQIRNNYEKDVFNGDIGYIDVIDEAEQSLTITFDGVRNVNYNFSEADELVLAYAISVHKAQGSEFPAVVLPVLTQHYVMLQRNLLYTAITRASKLSVLVGNKKALRIAIGNNQVSKRNSFLSQRLINLLD